MPARDETGIMCNRFISRQLGHPSGAIGRYLLPVVWNRRNSALNDSTLARLQLRAEDRVLDIGCGGGYLIGKMIKQAAAGHVSGVDASPVIARHCSSRFGRSIHKGCLDIQCAPADALPYPNNHFSKACSVNSLFYWPDLHQGLREIHRVLASHGLFVLTYTAKQDLDKRGYSPGAGRSYTDEETAGALLEAGFHDVILKHEADRHRGYSILSGRK
jgi:SAM-dependent methyltransferase